jgi:AcrR family transcriptional regulator
MPRPARERQMLDVAERVFAERGYQGTSMDEIAERCGVSKPMLYEYFGSKDGLLRAAIARARTELHETTRAAIEGATTPREILWRGMLAYFEFMEAHTRTFAMLLQEPMVAASGPESALEETRRQQSALIASVLASFAPDAPPDTIAAYAEIIIGASERLALWRLSRPDVTAEAAARHLTDFTWEGLRTHIPERNTAR